MSEAGDQTPTVRKRWALDREALDALLGSLAPDRELAGVKYEELRRRLMDLFAWERCEAPDELADEALNRLARKVREGATIPHLDRYAFGIARLLLQEENRRRRNQEAMVRELRTFDPKRAMEDLDALDAMDGCIESLPQDSRKLIQRYYCADRVALAREFGISANALRNRAMRIREQLFKCALRKRDKS